MDSFQTKRLTIGSTLVLLAISTVGFVGYRWLAMPSVTPHMGDGEFANRSWRWPFVSIGMPIPGYSIRFPAFDLGTEYHEEFYLEQLPDLDRHVGVYLCITDPGRRLRDDAIRKQLDAAFSCEIVDEQGQLIRHIDQQVSKMVWADPEGGPGCYGLYEAADSFFHPTKGACSKLRVRYAPDKKLSGYQGFVHIRCGGSI